MVPGNVSGSSKAQLLAKDSSPAFVALKMDAPGDGSLTLSLESKASRELLLNSFLRTRFSTSKIGHWRLAVKEFVMSASLALPTFGRVLCAAFKTRISIFLCVKYRPRAVRTSSIEGREVMSAATPCRVGASRFRVSGLELGTA